MNPLKSSSFNWSRVAIGTVQFGLRYGVANQVGMVSAENAEKILKSALLHGVSTLDTAISYGASEEILGQIGIESWQVISKLPRIPDGVEDIAGHILQQVESSLSRLNIQSLDGLLMHNPGQLLESSGHIIYNTLCDMRRQGLIKNIGISIYDPQDLNALLSNMDFNIVQAPLNIFDQRMLNSGWINELDKRKIAFHARSIFLQGLLLMENRPKFFSKWSNLFELWSHWLSKVGLTPLEGALYYAISNPAIKKIILGLDSLEHFQQIAQAIAKVEKMNIRVPDFDVTDALLLNPAKWQIS